MENRDASVTLQWADGVKTFSLKWGQMIELQEKLDAGPHYILQQFYAGNWKVQSIAEIIRLGLIGGGEVTPSEAYTLVENYVKVRPPMENLALAQAILTIGLIGAPEEAKGEAQAVPETETQTPND